MILVCTCSITYGGKLLGLGHTSIAAAIQEREIEEREVVLLELSHLHSKKRLACESFRSGVCQELRWDGM